MKLGLTISALSLALAAGSAMADGDADKGKKAFNKCKACHQVGEKAKNRTGPVLNGVVAGEVASVEGFKYSKAMLDFAAGGAVWDFDTLSAFLADPKGVVPKTKMTFKGLKKETDIDNVIAYLATFE